MAIAAPPIVSPSREDDAGFTPFVPASQDPAELTLRAAPARRRAGRRLRRLERVPGAQDRAHGLGVDSRSRCSPSRSSGRSGRSTILENNIVQTTGSAGESIAAGVVFTLPAILLMGYDLSIAKVGIIAAVGGILGILLMIPLRRALIVKEHKTLTYPEGTACAEVLIAGEKGGLQAQAALPGVRARVRLQVPHGGPQDVEGGRHPELRHSSAAARCRPRCRPNCSASATSSGRASPGTSSPAARSPTSCWCRRSSSSARAWRSRSSPRRCSSRT